MTGRDLRSVIFLLSLFFWAGNVSAAEGFREFRFGDSAATTLRRGEGLCQFSETKQHTRWNWITELECADYPFKRNVSAKILFEFAEDELVKIFVISKNIQNYLLTRYPTHSYLVPINGDDRKKDVNLAEQRLFRDKVHQLGDEYRYTTFFHEGNWEWEYYYEKGGHQKQESSRRKKQLEKEQEQGVEGWKKFIFGDSTSTIKEKLQGMCTSVEVVSGGNRNEMLTCHEFSFLEKKIPVMFYFQSDVLVKIELSLDRSLFPTLLPLMKKKYGTPYLELEKNQRYYPYIEFPASNVVLVHNKKGGKVSLVLKYLHKNYRDADRFEVNGTKKDAPVKSEKKGRSEKILDSI